MARKRYSPEDIIHKLREAEVLLSQGQTVRTIALVLYLDSQTFVRVGEPRLIPIRMVLETKQGHHCGGPALISLEPALLGPCLPLGKGQLTCVVASV